MRKAFEAWVKKLPYGCSLERYPSRTESANSNGLSGKYVDFKVQFAWEAWKELERLSKEYENEQSVGNRKRKK